MSAYTYGVGELIREVNAALAGGFGEVWVRGELSGVKVAASGHRYFQVKDADGQLSCAMWATRADRLKFKLEDGRVFLLRGRLEVYAQRGSLSFVVEEARPEGIGELQLAFEQMKAKLDAEGLFAAERKRPLPALPLRLGVVTSPSGAAVRDVLKVLSRWERLRVLLYPVRVQGKGAEGEIARAVRYLGRCGLVDVVLVVRGGGSLEDLWAFNEEIVARAIAASPVPVISGVGHEVDFTIADFVADVRAATPTQAAELVVAALERQQRRIDTAIDAVEVAFHQARETARLRLDAAVGSSGMARFPHRLREVGQRIRHLEPRPDRLRALVMGCHRRIDAAAATLSRWWSRFSAPRREAVSRQDAIAYERIRSLLARRRLELAGAERALDALSPQNVLQRGYSMTTREGESRPLTDAAAVNTGERIVTTFATGHLRSLVLGRSNGHQGSLFEQPGSGARGPGPGQEDSAMGQGSGGRAQRRDDKDTP